MPRPKSPLSAPLFNSLIASCARAGRVVDALSLLERMLAAGVAPTAFTFAPIFALPSATACCAAQLHPHILKSGLLHCEPYSGTSLVGFFGRRGRFDEALKVFGEMTVRSVVTWNCLISSFVQFGHSHDAVSWFRELVRSGDDLSDGSFVAVLPSFGLPEQVHDGHELGRFVHAKVIKHNLSTSVFVNISLVGFYSRGDAHKVLEGVPGNSITCWNALISGHSDCDDPTFALDPDSCSVSMNILAGICNKARMYQETKDLLLHKRDRDTISWSILITACTRNGDFVEAFGFFRQMRIFGHRFDNYVSVSLLSIYTKNNSLYLGKLIHGLIIKTNSSCSDSYVDNMLLDMYAKCGRIEDCLRVFEEMEDRNLISWTNVISGLGLNGFSRKALALFKSMEKDGCKPDKVAILAVLSSCRHGILVQEGMKILKNTKADYSIEADMGHYICVVDMLCKCGYLKEAELVIRGMPF
uniref:Pentatricopeptide repeat-containing protein n=1 Tax=Saccharum hybrid cultivar R570 TaxID=131158 RepID=A0A059Q0Q5_9POAL|nr:pentatricopeptide repeat-containing protein [Saccharum hybrid cultivar R570]